MIDAFAALEAALVGRYTFERRQDGSPPLLGRGGMAEVYLATDLRHHRQVALKALQPFVAHTAGAMRFLQEIEIDARLSHPNILPLLEAGSIDLAGQPPLLWFASPYVEGGTLRHRLEREGQLPIGVALHIARQVADALAHAHRHEVLHRDVKPENILLDGDDVFLSDFGIAKAMSLGAERITSADLAVGTIAYMSPEQAEGSGARHPDGRSDVYSLGCVLYEMLTGEPPFTGPSSQAVLARHKLDSPRPIRVVRPTVPRGLEQLVQRSLAKTPADRFATAADFAQVLRHPPEHWERQDRFRLSRPAAWLVGAAGLALLAVPALVWWKARAGSPVPGRIVVFPVASGPSPADSALADGATEALLATLSSASSFTAIDGRRLDPKASNESNAAAARAGYFVGAALNASDSLRLRLELHDRLADTVVMRTLAFAPGATGWEIGFHAAQRLVPFFFPTAKGPDFPLLETVKPEALAEFFRAEQRYRESAFEVAVGHYRRAVRLDSAFALAGLRGAQAATWTSQPDQARSLLGVALSREANLPPRFRRIAGALQAYLGGEADSAVARLRLTLREDGDSPEAWMLLGETYTHLLPAVGPLDSLAEEAFRQTHRLDSAFTPVLFHLIEFAARRGDSTGGKRALQRLREGQPDSLELESADLMLQCVARPLATTRWRAAVARRPDVVRAVAQSLSVAGLRQRACARDAWRALLAFDSSGDDQATNRRFGALWGLQDIMVAEGNDARVRALWDSDTLFNRRFGHQALLLDALATGRFVAHADSFAAAHFAQLAAGDSVGAYDLWLAASWAARRGRAEPEIRAVAETLAARARSGGARRDSLLARSLQAQLTLARGDTTLALEQLRRLTPNAAETVLLAWNPWESLGYERLLLTELLVARRNYPEALNVAAGFDAPAPLIYAIYLPAALELRLRAAEAWEEQSVARQARDRLLALRGDDTS